MSVVTRFITILSLSSLLTACAVGPDFHRPCPPNVGRYTCSPLPSQTVSARGPGGNAQCFMMGGDIPSQWWTLFHSEELNQLICRGIAHSPNLEAAQAALCQAEENLRAQIGSTMVPAINGAFTAERERFSFAALGIAPSVIGGQSPSLVFNLFNASLYVTYTLDVFGGLRRQIESMGALVDVQRFTLEAAYLTLTSNIVTTSISEASLCAQIKATCELIRAQTEQLRIMEHQYQLGGISGADVLTQQTLVAQTKALLPPLQKSLSQARHALSALVGAFPCQGGIPQFDLDALHLPEKLPVSLPSRLICQRPDVQIATALLQQASALIGVATANLLPQVSLPQFPVTTNYGSEAARIPDLFTQNAVVWALVGQVMQPIFNGGALIARRRAAICAYQEACAKYRETVLQAFQNVADVLRALELDAKTLKAQTIAEKSAKATLVMTEKQFRLGGVSYLTLLNAQQQYQQTVINRIQAQAMRYADTAALFQALGGGWWNRPNCCCNMH